jgi:hypothetical protein
MTDRPGNDNLLPTIEPSPTFATGVMARVSEIERLRRIERAQAHQTPCFLVACLGWALLLGWLVTDLLVSPGAALCYTLGYLLALLADAAPHVSAGAAVALTAVLAALLLRLRGTRGAVPQGQA